MLDAIDRWWFHATDWYRPALQEGYTRLEWHKPHGQRYWGDNHCSDSELSNLAATIRQHGYIVEITATPTSSKDAIGAWLASVPKTAMLWIYSSIRNRPPERRENQESAGSDF